MANHSDPNRANDKPAVRVNQCSDGSGGSLVLNIFALVLVAIGFLLHNWPTRSEGSLVTQNTTALPVAATLPAPQSTTQPDAPGTNP